MLIALIPLFDAKGALECPTKRKWRSKKSFSRRSRSGMWRLETNHQKRLLT